MWNLARGGKGNTRCEGAAGLSAFFFFCQDPHCNESQWEKLGKLLTCKPIFGTENQAFFKFRSRWGSITQALCSQLLISLLGEFWGQLLAQSVTPDMVWAVSQGLPTAQGSLSSISIFCGSMLWVLSLAKAQLMGQGLLWDSFPTPSLGISAAGDLKPSLSLTAQS